MEDRRRLIEIVKSVSYQYSAEPRFKLVSGALSNFYFNMKKTTMQPEGMFLVGKLVYGRIRECSLGIQAVGGLTLGADPIAYAASFYAYTQGDALRAFVVRKEPKAHGLGLSIEGDVKPRDHVVVVDDVVTTGGSTIKALRAAQDFGLRIVAVIVLVDRGEFNGIQNIQALGYPVHAILTVKDFL